MRRGPAGQSSTTASPRLTGLRGAASRLDSLASLVEPRLSDVPLDCGDVPVGGLRSH